MSRGLRIPFLRYRSQRMAALYKPLPHITGPIVSTMAPVQQNRQSASALANTEDACDYPLTSANTWALYTNTAYGFTLALDGAWEGYTTATSSVLGADTERIDFELPSSSTPPRLWRLDSTLCRLLIGDICSRSVAHPTTTSLPHSLEAALNTSLATSFMIPHLRRFRRIIAAR